MKTLATISRLSTAIGWTGALGCALLASAIVLVLAHLLPAREEAHALGGELQRLERQTRSAPSAGLSEAALRQQLDAFLRSLPAQDALNGQLNRLHELAARHRLTLKNGDYRTVIAKGKRIHRLQISVKTEASYADLRRFLREVPAALPALSINRLSMTRQRLSDTRLETAVEFVLFFTGSES
ncbi:MAG: type 4a pilus biogenesis protein PilO [Betaproteobacteria bacterium]|nr:type 4a pilus biogenesis protein PilO [Betaproteobacteria bacterium]